MRNRASISKEITALTALKERLPEFNLLGESIHGNIDIQVAFMEKRLADFQGAKLDLSAGKKAVAANAAEMQALGWLDSEEDSKEAPSKTYDPVYRTRLKKAEIAAGKSK